MDNGWQNIRDGIRPTESPKTEIRNEDCRITISQMAENSVDIILTSPPYNTGRVSHTEKWRNEYQGRYDVYVDNMTQQEYIDWTLENFRLFDRVLNKDGVILYNMSYGTDATVNVASIGLSWLTAAEIIKKTPFTIADRVVWKKRNALPNNTSSNKCTRICEDVWVICRKEEIKTFKSGKKIMGIRKDRPSQKYYSSMYNFLEARNNDGKCSLNKATFSTDLVKKLLKMYAASDCKLVYDPFAGIGTTAVACKELGIPCICSEISEKQCTLAVKRLNETQAKKNCS